MPADKLLTISDPLLAAACFAYVASSFAHDASTAHVALSSRYTIF